MASHFESSQLRMQPICSVQHDLSTRGHFIQHFQGRRHDVFYLVGTGTKYLYVANHGGLQLVIRCPVPVKTAELIITGKEHHIVILANTGDVYSLQLPKLHKKKKRKDENKGERPDNQSIFSELLHQDDDDDGIPLDEHEDEVPVLITITEEQLALPKTSAITIRCSLQYLVTLVNVKCGLILNYYKLDSVIKRQDPQVLCTCFIPSTNLTDEKHFKTSLHCLLPDGAICSGKDSVSTPSAVILEDKLFSALFGTDSSLLSQPMFLVCIQGGAVFSVTGKCPDSDLCYKLLCHTGQDIVAVTGLNNTPSGGCNKLLIVGHHGKVNSLNINEEGSLEFNECSISGPVMKALADGHTLVHTTGDAVFSNLWTEGVSRAITNTIVYPVCDVQCIGITPKALNIPTPQDGELKLLLTTRGGDLSVATLQRSAKSGPSDHTKYTTEDLKDMMTRIAQTSQTLLQTEEALRENNHLIGQLAIASVLIGQFHAGTESKEKFFELSMKVVHHDYGNKISSTLSVSIKNVSNILLTGDWVYQVSISSNNNNSHHSKCVTLSNLTPDGFQETEFKMDPTWHLPLSLNCTLILCLDSAYYKSDMATSIGDSSKCLVIPIAEEKLDILHMLRTGSSKRSAKEVVNSNSSFAAITLQAAKERPGYRLHDVSKEETSEPSGQLTLQRHLPAKFVKSLKLKKTDKVEQELLKDLLKDSAGFDELTGTSVKASTMDGHQVVLSVQRMDTDGKTRPEYKFIVHVPDAALLTQFSEALKYRLQPFWNQEKKVKSSTSHRESIRKLEHLEKEVETLQESLTSRVSRPSDFKHQVYSLYERLLNLDFTFN